MEKLILSKYKSFLIKIDLLSQSQIEELIFYLENEIMKHSFSTDGLIANYIKLLKNIELRKRLSEEEMKCIENLKNGVISDISYIDDTNKKILKRINKEI